MASIVIIKEVLGSVTVDANGRATHLFTVTNQAGRRQPVGLELVVGGGADSSWFQIEGGSELEFDTGASQQVKVSFQAPSGVKSGRYTLRLLVYSAIKGRADEDFTEGPMVGITVPDDLDLPPEPQPEPPKKKFPWWIVAVAIAVLLIIIGIAWWLWPSGMEDGTDRPGQDYRSFEMDSAKADPRLCQAACEQETQCLAWTYAKPNQTIPNASCWLKSGVPAPTPNAGAISGVKK